MKGLQPLNIAAAVLTMLAEGAPGEPNPPLPEGTTGRSFLEKH